MNDAWEPRSGSAASSLNVGNGREKLNREFMQQTSRLLKRKAAINHLTRPSNETASLCAVVAGFGRRAPPPVRVNRLLFGFDDVPPYYLNRLLTLGCKVRPGFRLVECHCVIHAVPFDDAHTLWRGSTLYLNNPSGCGA